MLIGLIGKPSAGKSTFFASATMANVEISERPFTTIKPNFGIGFVRVEDIGPELGVTSQPKHGYLIGNIRYVPVELVDVAGLIPGASMGKGLGNQFMNDLARANALIHIVDISGGTDEKGNFIGYGKHDPLEDIKWLENEITLWISGIVERNKDKMIRLARQGKSPKDVAYEMFSSFGITDGDAKDIENKFGAVESWQSESIAQFIRERTKPIVIAANKIDLPFGKENFEKAKALYPNIIAVSAESELALKKASKASLIKYAPGESSFEFSSDLNEMQKNALEKIAAVLKEHGSTGVQQIIEYATFGLLGSLAIFPAGAKLKDKDGRILPDCFILPKNSTLHDFAMKIHSDIAKNMLYGIDARSKKRLAKDYPLKHKDAVEIVSTVKKES